MEQEGVPGQEGRLARGAGHPDECLAEGGTLSDAFSGLRGGRVPAVAFALGKTETCAR